MDSPQGSTFTANMTELVDGSTARRQVSYVDRLPVYAKELIAGGAAGAFAKTTVAPLERTKILLQTRTDGFRSLGVYQSLRKVLNHEGVLGFYKGNGASVIRIIPYAALHFMTYEQYRGWILHNYSSMGSGPFVDLLAGSASGGTAVLCTYPLDLARTKLAYQVTDTGTNIRSGIRSLYPQPAYSGIRDVVTRVYKEAGIRGLYRGVGPTLVGILPYAGLKFYVYEVLKTHVPEEQRKSIVMHLSCGAVAGLLGQTFTYPLDVVRRQMQVENLQCSTIQGGVTRYRNTLDGLTTIVRYQGWRQLFAGLSINYMKMVPSVAVGFAGEKVFLLLNCLFSSVAEHVTCKEILKRQFFSYTDMEKDTVRSISLEKDDGEKHDPQSPIKEPKLEASDSFRHLALDQGNVNSVVSNDKANGIVIPEKPTIMLPKPVIMFSPRPLSDLDAAAATKLQKVYRGYRTRRNLADCAVVVEELWWKTLDSAALRRCSVSFYDNEKHETVISKWARAKTRAAKVGKGLSKDEKAQKLALQHWLEAIDPRHRYGHNLHFYYDAWSASKSSQPFFYWLDIGDGKELNLKKCKRTYLQRQCIKYLGPKERKAFEVIVESGKLIYKQSGMLVNTIEGSKWIFVLSTTRSLYVGKKKKGAFQHSSFLSGGATTAAGRLVVSHGVLEAIWPYSGHYLPTEDNFKEFIIFLEEHNVDLTDVKRCAVDEDYTSNKVAGDESKHGVSKDLMATAKSTESKAVEVDDEPKNDSCIRPEYLETSMDTIAANLEAEAFNMVKRLSCKWTSGISPRIGCVREYPKELQSQALEQVNLSPRSTPGRFANSGPIPSPRPSHKIRVSPRLAYMGLPSPRVSVMASK
ncbi:hypothetical protein V6N13_002398 [Hibiscus sabdariffa]